MMIRKIKLSNAEEAAMAIYDLFSIAVNLSAEAHPILPAIFRQLPVNG